MTLKYGPDQGGSWPATVARAFSASAREIDQSGDAGPIWQDREAYTVMPIRAVAPQSAWNREAAVGRTVPRRPWGHRRAELLPSEAFAACLSRELQRTNRSGRPFVLAIFSAERSVYGHRAVLQDLSRLLQSRVRATDILGWYGPAAVAVLLSDTDLEGGKIFADQIIGESGDAPLRVAVTKYPDQAPVKPPPASAVGIDSLRYWFSGASRTDAARSPVKRILDVVGAVVAIILFAPIMLGTAVAIKATSPGPVIFRQMRLGFEGTPFVFLKFRSMRVDADDELHRQYTQRFVTGQLDEAAGEAPLYKITSDPRLTPIGNFIRKTSIDELPQLFNVLKGEMSLVGPRPPLPYEVDRYQPWHLRRILDVKPGMTGLWQVEGRSTTTFDDMVRLDLRYVDRWSIWLDLKILLKTVKAVVTCRGAF